MMVAMLVMMIIFSRGVRKLASLLFYVLVATRTVANSIRMCQAVPSVQLALQVEHDN